MKSNIDIENLNILEEISYDSGVKHDPEDLTELSNDNYVYASDLNKICDTLNLLIGSSNIYAEIFRQLKTDLDDTNSVLSGLITADNRKKYT
jgi:hypothetical protein